MSENAHGPTIRHALLRWTGALRRDLAALLELRQRRQLLDRPWREEMLHFAPDGQLHGHLVPTAARHGSTTTSGWCPCWARSRARELSP